MEKPYKGRAVIHESFNELKIEIPARRNWFVIAFVAVWLIGWVIGEVFALGMLTGVIEQKLEAGLNNVFMLFWLLAWSAGGVFVIRTWFYMTFGSEILTFNHGKLIVDKRFALFYKPKIYDLTQARNLSVNTNYRRDPLAIRRFQTWNLNAEGALKFDYGLQTVFFANDIDKQEAYHLIGMLKEKPIW